MQKNLLLAFSIVLLASTLFAQADFRNGYILTHTNDTLYGLIDYRGNAANAKICVFKTDKNAPNTFFSPNDILGYRFTDSKYFVSKTIHRNNQNQQLFLEYLINGIIDVFYYSDKNGEYYLISDENGTLHFLDNTEKDVVINDMLYKKKSYNYLGTLKAAYSQSPEIIKQVDGIKTLNHKTLINLSEQYHQQVCEGEQCIVYERKLPKSIKKYGLLVGINAHTFSVINPYIVDVIYFDSFNFSTIHKISPSLGFYYEQTTPNYKEKTFVRYEGSISKINMVNSNNYNKTFTLNQLIVTNNLNINYRFSQYKMKPSIGMGGFMNYALSNKSSLTHINVELTSENPFSTMDYGLSINAGFDVNIIKQNYIHFNLRYQRGFGLSNNVYTNHYSLLLSYPLN